MSKDSIDTYGINVADTVENTYQPTAFTASEAQNKTLVIDGDQATYSWGIAYIDLGSIYSITGINVYGSISGGGTNSITLAVSSSETTDYTQVTWTSLPIAVSPTNTQLWQFSYLDVDPQVPRLVRWIKIAGASNTISIMTLKEVEAIVQSGWHDYEDEEGTVVSTQDLYVTDSGGNILTVASTTDVASLPMPSVIPGDSATTHFTIIPEASKTLFNTYVVTVHNANDQDPQKVEDYVYYGPSDTGPWSDHQYSIGTVSTSTDVFVMIAPPPIDSGTIEGFKNLYFDITYQVIPTDEELVGMV